MLPKNNEAAQKFRDGLVQFKNSVVLPPIILRCMIIAGSMAVALAAVPAGCPAVVHPYVHATTTCAGLENGQQHEGNEKNGKMFHAS